ncbi:unnamed protein product [Calypogeia fissa]
MGPQTGTPTDLEAKSYAPLNLGASGTSVGDDGGAWTRGGQRPWRVFPWPYEWPLGHTSGPDGRAWAPKCPKGVLLVVPPLSSPGLGGSCILALGLGAKNKYKGLGPKLAWRGRSPEAYMRGVVSSRCLGRIRLEGNPSENGNGHKFGPSCPFVDLLVSLESL